MVWIICDSEVEVKRQKLTELIKVMLETAFGHSKRKNK